MNKWASAAVSLIFTVAAITVAAFIHGNWGAFLDTVFGAVLGVVLYAAFYQKDAA